MEEKSNKRNGLHLHDVINCGLIFNQKERAIIRHQDGEWGYNLSKHERITLRRYYILTMKKQLEKALGLQKVIKWISHYL